MGASSYSTCNEIAEQTEAWLSSNSSGSNNPVLYLLK